jgi:DNA repair photolyase
VRWDNLRADDPVVDAGSADRDAGTARAVAPLPLALPGAVARTFDTPGFAGMTFYEVQAKSIINRVPSASRVPFEWTINPYRGCSHACVYCLAGDTPILMADGRTRPLSQLRTGDAIYGTVRDGSYRRYVVTEVLAHWRTVKPAYRVTLQDGTKLVASGDHRFLTDRGWKHVTGQESGPLRRPHLTTGNKLMGMGRFAPAPADTPDYRRGYLCGLVRAEERTGGRRQRFRLALADPEAVERADRYLAGFEIPATRFAYQAATAGRRATTAIRTAGNGAAAAVRSLVSWPEQPSPDWCAGFLAGIFDAEGSYSRGGILRIADTDSEVLRRTGALLRDLGFDIAVEVLRAHSRGLTNIRIRGGLPEHVRFFHLVDPAITRKRTIVGTAIKTDRPLGVVSVEPLGVDLPMYDVTTGTGDFIANGIVSHNCFARNTHTYLDLDAGRDFDTRVVVKVNAGKVLRHELSAPKWTGSHLAMGTNVDCYQRAEGKYRLMREILAALRDFANPYSILTKGTLILRDLDLLRQSAEVTRVSLSVSIGFVDEALWRAVEPGTPSPRRRLDVVRQLTDAGFPVGVLVAPILPGLSDDDESIEATVKALAAAGAAGVTPIPLHLRPGAREWYQGWLARTRPDLVARYRALFRGGSYSPAAYQRDVSARVKAAARRHGIGAGEPGEARRVEPERPSPPEAVQLTLPLM